MTQEALGSECMLEVGSTCTKSNAFLHTVVAFCGSVYVPNFSNNTESKRDLYPRNIQQRPDFARREIIVRECYLEVYVISPWEAPVRHDHEDF